MTEMQELAPVAWLFECTSGPYAGEIDVHSLDGKPGPEEKRVERWYSEPFPVVRLADAAARILTLERERDEAREAVDAFADICDELGCERDNEAGLQAAHVLKARATAAEAQVQALREALEPFAKAADDGEGMLRDGGYPFPADDAPAGYEQRHGGYVQMTPLWGHLRRARAALRCEP